MPPIGQQLAAATSTAAISSISHTFTASFAASTSSVISDTSTALHLHPLRVHPLRRLCCHILPFQSIGWFITVFGIPTPLPHLSAAGAAIGMSTHNLHSHSSSSKYNHCYRPSDLSSAPLPPPCGQQTRLCWAYDYEAVVSGQAHDLVFRPSGIRDALTVQSIAMMDWSWMECFTKKLKTKNNYNDREVAELMHIKMRLWGYGGAPLPKIRTVWSKLINYPVKYHGCLTSPTNGQK